MMTIHAVAELAGVTVRTLHYYDRIGLFPATETTAAGYRLYDEAALEKLQLILLYRELEFPLKEIKKILTHPKFDREKVLEQQIVLLKLRKERLENLIRLAEETRQKGDETMSRIRFDAFDTKKLEEYEKEAKKIWGETNAYKEYEQKSKDRTKNEQKDLNEEMMEIFARFGSIKDKGADSKEASDLAKKLQNFITEHYYTCTDTIFSSLALMYGAGGEMTGNIDLAGGEGTGAFAGAAIEAYLKKRVH